MNRPAGVTVLSVLLLLGAVGNLASLAHQPLRLILVLVLGFVGIQLWRMKESGRQGAILIAFLQLIIGGIGTLGIGFALLIPVFAGRSTFTPSLPQAIIATFFVGMIACLIVVRRYLQNPAIVALFAPPFESR